LINKYRSKRNNVNAIKTATYEIEKTTYLSQLKKAPATI